MKLTQLEKAQKLYARIKELDAEILDIERVAQLISSKKSEINFSLKVTDLEKVKESDKVKIDEDGSLSCGKSSFDPLKIYFTFGSPKAEVKKKEFDATVKHSVTDTIGLQLLAVILAEKVNARTLAIKALNKIGVEI